MPRDGNRARRWCFTINNYSDEDVARIREHGRTVECTDQPVRYIIFGREKGSEGTPHLQGYIEFRRALRLRGVKSIVGERAHCEASKGTPTQAAEYCKKENDYETFGSLSTENQGRRSDLEIIRDKIKDGVPEIEIADEHFNQWVVYRRSFEAYRSMCHPSETRPELMVYGLYGMAGAGKTRFSFEYAKARGQEPYIVADLTLQWWDGYRGQEVVIIDDFRGEASISLFKRYTDIYPCQVPIKGGFRELRCKEIWITSNLHPEQWYPEGKYETEDVRAIQRRIGRSAYVTLEGISWSDKRISIAESLGLERIEWQ